MASITLLNIPDALYSELVQRASRHGRTVEDEAINCLDAAVHRRPRRESVNEVLAELDRFRGSLGSLRVTEEDLQRAKREGRP